MRASPEGPLPTSSRDPREAEHLPVGRVRLGQPVAVQQRAVAGLELEALFLVVHAGHQPERHAAGPQLLHAVAGPHVRHVVAGVGELDLAADRVEHQGQAGDEHVRRDVHAEHLVDVAEDLAGRDQPGRRVPQQRVRAGHHQRGRDALVGDVADDEHDPAVRQRDEVVEVAAHRAGRAVERGHVPARAGRAGSSAGTAAG